MSRICKFSLRALQRSFIRIKNMIFNSQICPGTHFEGQSPIISVEGNLGSGKTTFLKLLSEHVPEFTLMKEPVEQWQNVQGHNLLELYYKNFKRWSFTFQTYALFSRMQLWRRHQIQEPGKLKLSERSMLADRNIFGSLMEDLHNVEPVETAIYREVTSEVIREWPLAGIIYLKCTPETCFTRIKKRNRHEEEEVPLEYLQLVHDKHQTWISKQTTSKVLVIDTDYYDVTLPEDQQRIVSMVREFIHKLNNTS